VSIYIYWKQMYLFYDMFYILGGLWRVNRTQILFWSLESSGMYCHVVKYILTDVTEVHSASIIRAQYAPLKRRSTSTWLHGSTSQKNLHFILATVRNWNLTHSILFIDMKIRKKVNTHCGRFSKLLYSSTRLKHGRYRLLCYSGTCSGSVPWNEAWTMERYVGSVSIINM
jgi:hypothetical protein